MGKVNVLVPKKGGGIIAVTASWDASKNALVAPNNGAVLDKEIVFLAPEQSDNATLNIAIHAGYKYAGQ